MADMLGQNTMRFQSPGGSFLQPPQQMPQQPQATGGFDKRWALMQALSQSNKGGGVAGLIPQIAGAYMLKNGGFGGGFGG